MNISSAKIVIRIRAVPRLSLSSDVSPEYREVERRCGAQHLRLELAAVLQHDFDGAGVPNHVEVGDDEAALAIDNDAGPRSHRRLEGLVGNAEIAPEEGILQQWVLLGRRGHQCRDVDDGR